MGDQNHQEADVESLQRVLTRLVLTDEDKLESVLSRLLPLVIGKLSNAGSALQKAVMDILTHCNKRLQAAPTIAIPLQNLLDLYRTNSSPLVRSFSLVYIEKGMQRASPDVRFSHLDQLLANLSQKPLPHQDILLRIAVTALEHLSQSTNAFAFGSPEAFAAKYTFLKDDSPVHSADRATFLDFALRVMLYTPPTARGPKSALAAGHASMQRSVSVPPATPLPQSLVDHQQQQQQPGLSIDDINKIEGKSINPIASTTLQNQKLGILNFTSLAEIPPNKHTLLIYLAAACDANEAISKRGEELLKKRCSVDAYRPAIDVEDVDGIVIPCYHLFLGSMDDENIPPTKKRAPASVAVKSRLLSLFCKSIAAANASPYNSMTLTTCVFNPLQKGSTYDANNRLRAPGNEATAAPSGVATTPRLQQQGMEFAVWMLKHANIAILLPIVPVIVENCLALLDKGTGTAPQQQQDSTMVFLRSFGYQALGHIAQRLPGSLRNRTDIAARFFDALAAEPAGVRAAVQEATSCLALAFEHTATQTAAVLADFNNDNSINRSKKRFLDKDSSETTSQDTIMFDAPGADTRDNSLDNAHADAIIKLLESSIRHREEAVRGAAMQWIIRLYPFSHVHARYLCILGAGDSRFQLAEAAIQGLKHEKFTSPQRIKVDADGDGGGNVNRGMNGSGSRKSTQKEPHRETDYPALHDMIEYLCYRHPRLKSRVEYNGELPMQPASYAAAIEFLQECGHGGGGYHVDDDDMGHYFSILENALVKQAPASLHTITLSSMLDLSSQHRAMFVATYAVRAEIFERLLSHVDSTARDAAARLLGMLSSGMSIDHTICQIVDPACRALEDSLNGKKGLRYERLDGSCMALGYVLAEAMRYGGHSRYVGDRGGTGMGEKNSSALAVGDTGSGGSDILLYGDALCTLCNVATHDTSSVLEGSIDNALKSTAALAFGYIAVALCSEDGHQLSSIVQQQQQSLSLLLRDSSLVALYLKKVPIIIACISSTLIKDRDPKVAKKAIQSLGFVAYGLHSVHTKTPRPFRDPIGSSHEGAPDNDYYYDGGGGGSGSILETITSTLLEQNSAKNEDVLFAVGESLAYAFGGVTISPDEILKTAYTSLSQWTSRREQQENSDEHAYDNSNRPLQQQEEEEEEEGREMQVSLVQETKEQKQILSAILDHCITHSRPEIRSAGAIWLVSLLLFCNDNNNKANNTSNARDTSPSALLHSMIPRAQDALCSLLGDENELTQEMASKGLAACYELAADETMRASLVDSLVAVLSGSSGSKRRAGDITGDTKLFEQGAFGNTAPPGCAAAASSSSGGGQGSRNANDLTTYKEICALATDLGQPDLVYKFMQLANHNATVNASRGAAFGFASVAKLAGGALAARIDVLVPRLYRSLYDPQPKVRDAMQHIWVALVDDPTATLTRTFDRTLAALLQDMVGNQWRSRESAASAAADLIQGRRWDELRPRFALLWSTSLRVMDDVKETVRVAGIGLVRALRGLTFRLVDPELTSTAEGKEAIATALPVLLEVGMPSKVPEVQGMAVDTTAKLVKAAGAELVRPHMKAIVPAMIESLSGLEDSRLNYLEQHAARLHVDAEKLESARVSASQGSAVGDTLDLCARHIDVATFVDLSPTLAGLVRRGVGLNTRAGAGRFIAGAARRLGVELAGGAASATSQLMRALEDATTAERSAMVRRSYAAAFAMLAKHASHARIEKFVRSWLDKIKADDDGDAASSRRTIAVLLRALSREASEAFADHAAIIAPVAYFAQYDDDASAADEWKEIWEESTASMGAGLRLHVDGVLDVVLAALASSQWNKKKAAATAIVHLCRDCAGDVLMPRYERLMQALMAEVPGRLWEGKERVMTAVGAACVACCFQQRPSENHDDACSEDAIATVTVDRTRAVTVVRLLSEAASKKKAVYRKEALEQLTLVLQAWMQHSKGSVSVSKMKHKESGAERNILEMVYPVLRSLTQEECRLDTKSDIQDQMENSGGKSHDTTSMFRCTARCWGAVWQIAVKYESLYGDGMGLEECAMQWVSEAMTVAMALIQHASKIQDQTAAMDAASNLVSSLHNRALCDSTPGGEHARWLVSKDSWIELVMLTKRLGEDGKSAALREKSIMVFGLLLKILFSDIRRNDENKFAERSLLSDDEKKEWKNWVESMIDREKVPAIKMQLAVLLNDLK